MISPALLTSFVKQIDSQQVTNSFKTTRVQRESLRRFKCIHYEKSFVKAFASL